MLVMLAGCGQEDTLTTEDVGGMSNKQSMGMLDCQMAKMVKEEGRAAERKLFNNEMDKAYQNRDNPEDITPIQVTLAERGYECPEYLSEE